MIGLQFIRRMISFNVDELHRQTSAVENSQMPYITEPKHYWQSMLFEFRLWRTCNDPDRCKHGHLGTAEHYFTLSVQYFLLGLYRRLRSGHEGVFMNIDGNIRITEPTDPRGVFSARWEGGKLAYFSRSMAFALKIDPKPGEVFRLHGLGLRVVGEEFGELIVTPNIPVSVLYRLSWMICDFARSVYHRIILTIYVWGLADHDVGAYPSWRDIGMVKWVMKRWLKT